MESFFQISILFSNYWPKTDKQIAWTLIEVQFIVYQWIWLKKLYKLMESFFQISESFFELVTI